MDLSNWISVASEHLTSFFRDLTEMLTHPKQFAERRVLKAKSGKTGLDADFWVFLVISAFVGLMIQSFTPFRRESELTRAIVILLATWFAFAVYAHLLATTVFGGTAAFARSAEVAVRAIAVAYILSSVTAFFVGFYAGAFDLRREWSAAIGYLSMQGALLLLVGGVALAATHGIGGVRRMALILAVPLPVAFFNVFVLFYAAETGGIGPK